LRSICNSCGNRLVAMTETLRHSAFLAGLVTAEAGIAIAQDSGAYFSLDHIKSPFAISRCLPHANEARIQRTRYAGATYYSNAAIPPADVRRHCALGAAATDLLTNASIQSNLSALVRSHRSRRANHRRSRRRAGDRSGSYRRSDRLSFARTRGFPQRRRLGKLARETVIVRSNHISMCV